METPNLFGVKTRCFGKSAVGMAEITIAARGRDIAHHTQYRIYPKTQGIRCGMTFFDDAFLGF